MNAMHGIDVFNIVMGLGIAVLVLAIQDIERSNKVLRDRNQYEREHENELLCELDCLDESSETQGNGRRQLGRTGSHSV